jgi:hypothetical protein
MSVPEDLAERNSAEDTFHSSTLPDQPPSDPERDGPKFKAVPKIPYPVVPFLFPRGSLSYIIATPKTGARRFILSQMENYAAGLPFLNIPSQAPEFPPEQMGIVVCGCRASEITDRIERLGLTHLQKPGVCPVVRWDAATARKQPEKFPLQAAYEAVGLMGKRGDPKFLFVESIQLLMISGKSNDQQPVGEFVSQLLEFAEAMQCAIVGTVGTAKVYYRKLSQRIAGSSQWGVGASTLIGIDVNEKSKTKMRKVVIQSSEGFEETFGSVFYADFDDRRRLVPCEPPEPEERPTAVGMREMTTRLEMAEYGSLYTRTQFIGWGKENGVGRRLVGEWIAEMIQMGMIQPEGTNRDRSYVRVDQAGNAVVN